MQREKDCKRRMRKRYAAGLLACLMIFSVICPQGLIVGSIEAQAAESTSELKESVQRATKLLEKVLDSQYKQKEEELKEIIMDKGYDYTMTMETFFNNGNPFKNINYIDLFATYSTIKEYCDLNGIPLGEGLGGVPFLTMTVTERALVEKTPELVPIYQDLGKGYFELTGNEIIYEDTTISIYEEYEPGKYRYAGTKEINIQKKEILYAEVLLSVIEPSMLYEIFQVSKKELKKTYESRLIKLTNEINGTTLKQSVFIRTRNRLYENSEISEDMINYLINTAPTERQEILRTAVSLLGQVPYEFGGKAKAPGYDTSWWTYEENEQKGLDCSGFVQWVFMTCGYDDDMINQMISTTSIRDFFENCSYEEMLPGDLGLLNLGETTNHTGIYLGEGYFIHCSSGSGTVVINQFPFRYFKKVEIEKSPVDTDTLTNYYKNNYTNGVFSENISENDIDLLSRLIEHEAGNQGYNGWVAVGEVVINRVESDLFPDTLSEVIYDHKQFTNASELSTTVPRDGIREVAEDLLSGRIRLFNNKDVLYFKNPVLTDGISPEQETDWGGHAWYKAIGEHAFYLQ